MSETVEHILQTHTGIYFGVPADRERLLERLRDAAAAEHAAGRLAGIRQAAEVAYRTCAETRHVTLGDKAKAAILALAEGKEG